MQSVVPNYALKTVEMKIFILCILYNKKYKKIIPIVY